MSSGVEGRISPSTITKVTESNTEIVNSISNLSSRAGFNYSGNDQDNRKEKMQEQINNCVTSKQIRTDRKYSKKHGEEKRIEGLEQYNNEECSPWDMHRYGVVITLKMNLLARYSLILTRQVSIVLANQPEFAEAFNCAVGTPMNPKERCAVWD
ncbi:unnamed protein product [Haemonchus placei]|uniref:Peptidase_M13 domain-containing protein n=1 Tax=Haemonchus placei TaxID=6290 RepID=A0A0N4W8Z4_HAEPC|nr:unnamed protein product [Haemonchus placei]